MSKHAAHKHVVEKRQPKHPIDYIVYFFMVATPLFELPQAYQIYSSKSAANVSVATWVFFLLASCVWWFYSFKHKLYPLVFMYSCYFFIELAIVAGIVMYS